MTSKHVSYILTAIIILLGLASVASVYYGNSYLADKSQNISNLKIENYTLEEQQRSLIQAKKDIEKYAELERTAKSVVPQEKDQARTVREIVKIASESGVPIANISFPASTLGQAAKPSSAQPSTGASAAGPTTQVKPVEGINGVYLLEISVQSAPGTPVRYESMLNFLSKLQQNRRTAQVTNLTVTPSPTDRNRVVFTLTINAYIKP